MPERKIVPLPFLASAAEGTRHVFVRDLVLPGRIGVHRHEERDAQRVRINVDLAVDDEVGAVADRLEDVVCYESVAEAVRRIVGEGHVKLVETLAERIAAFCLADRRVATARVRVEKLDVFADASGAGVEIERRRRPRPGGRG